MHNYLLNSLKRLIILLSIRCQMTVIFLALQIRTCFLVFSTIFFLFGQWMYWATYTVYVELIFGFFRSGFCSFILVFDCRRVRHEIFFFTFTLFSLDMSFTRKSNGWLVFCFQYARFLTPFSALVFVSYCLVKMPQWLLLSILYAIFGQ